MCKLRPKKGQKMGQKNPKNYSLSVKTQNIAIDHPSNNTKLSAVVVNGVVNKNTSKILHEFSSSPPPLMGSQYFEKELMLPDFRV